jgi:hypothetical protein
VVYLIGSLLYLLRYLLCEGTFWSCHSYCVNKDQDVGKIKPAYTRQLLPPPASPLRTCAVCKIQPAWPAACSAAAAAAVQQIMSKGRKVRDPLHHLQPRLCQFPITDPIDILWQQKLAEVKVSSKFPSISGAAILPRACCCHAVESLLLLPLSASAACCCCCGGGHPTGRCSVLPQQQPAGCRSSSSTLPQQRKEGGGGEKSHQRGARFPWPNRRGILTFWRAKLQRRSRSVPRGREKLILDLRPCGVQFVSCISLKVCAIISAHVRHY